MIEKLSAPEIELRTNLLKQFRAGSLSLTDAQKLKDLLEREKEEIWDTGDLLLFFLIILLLGLVIAYLGNNEVDLKSLDKTIDKFICGKSKTKRK